MLLMPTLNLIDVFFWDHGLYIFLDFDFFICPRVRGQLTLYVATVWQD